jgi:ADP-heptose:LPS heptosyltransferase
MDREAQFGKFFKITSLVTDHFPSAGGRFLDFTFKNLLGNPLLLKAATQLTRKRLSGIEKYDRFLVAADLNIGDAVTVQGAIMALKDIFPGAQIDCVIKKSAKDFMEGNPNISQLYPVYQGAPFPAENDLAELSRIADIGDYDLILNFSPMVNKKIFHTKRIISYSMMAVELVRNEKSMVIVNNVAFQAYKFIGSVFRKLVAPDFEKNFKGTQVYLSDESLEGARRFLLGNGLALGSSIIMFNPDASAKFTMMPFDLQLSLLRGLADLDCNILLGAGHVDKYVEHKLIHSLSPRVKKRIVIVPRTVPLDVYAAMIDFAGVYISGDTGPLHLAAARKFSRDSGEGLRNKTAIFSVFGGTPSRIYGYDSEKPGYLPANQDAPSRVFSAKSPCRNITCINKMAKTCKEVRCFQMVDPNEIVTEAANHLRKSRKSYKLEQLRILAK